MDLFDEPAATAAPAGAAPLAERMRPRTIEECVESILSQSHPGIDVELLLIDNTSSDGTASILARYHGSVAQDAAGIGDQRGRTAEE